MPKKKTATEPTQTTLPFPFTDEEHLDISTLETWLLDAANTIRGASDAPKFKDFILPLIFYKRLSDVFDDEFAKQIEEFGSEEVAREIVEADHEDALKSGRNPIVRFYIPPEYHWKALRNHSADGHLWNQKEYDEAFYESDNWNRFSDGIAPSSSADWGWVQHILASLEENGRAAIVLDTGAVSRGSGSQNTDRERDIRKKFVKKDLIEGVVLLPENLFYNTTAPGIILLLNRNKPEERKDQILLINLSQHFEKGKPKNILTDDAIDVATEVYQTWESREKLSSVITLEDAQKTDYNLSPSQFVDVGDKVEHRPVNEILSDLTEAHIAREKADNALEDVLARLGLNEQH